MKSIFVSLALILLVLVGVTIWETRPLTPVGKANRVVNWTHKGYEMEVWQIKKAIFSEPLSTSFYVRYQTNAWHQYYLNHQDYYGSCYDLSETNGIVSVTRDGKILGTLTISTGKYERTGGGVSLEDTFWRNPP